METLWIVILLLMKSNIDELADNINNSSLLILGGTGLFAKELLPRLINRIERKNIKTVIYITTRSKTKAISFIPEIKKSYIRFITVDFLKNNEIGIDINPKYIIHMATTSAYETFNKISQLSKFLVLKNSSEAVSKLIEKNDVKRLLFVSSGVAYGNVEIYDENTKACLDYLDSKNSLAVGKLYSEFLLNSVCEANNTEFKIARCFSFISKYLPYDIHYAVGNFVRDAVNEKDIVIKSDGKDIRSYQDISDAVEWLSFLLNKDFPYKVINIGSDIGITIYDLAKKVKHLLNANSKIIVKNNNIIDDNNKRVNYVPSLKLAYKIGLKQRVKLEDSIIKLAEHIKKENLNNV